MTMVVAMNFLDSMIQWKFDRSKITEIINLEPNFSVSVFEHGYLSCYLSYQGNILCVYS